MAGTTDKVKGAVKEGAGLATGDDTLGDIVADYRAVST